MAQITAEVRRKEVGGKKKKALWKQEKIWEAKENKKRTQKESEKT